MERPYEGNKDTVKGISEGWYCAFLGRESMDVAASKVAKRHVDVTRCTLYITPLHTYKH
jgi:hypothetical protein